MGSWGIIWNPKLSANKSARWRSCVGRIRRLENRSKKEKVPIYLVGMGNWDVLELEFVG